MIVEPVQVPGNRIDVILAKAKTHLVLPAMNLIPEARPVGPSCSLRQ